MQQQSIDKLLSANTAEEFSAFQKELGVPDEALWKLSFDVWQHWGNLHHAWPDDYRIDEDPPEFFETLAVQSP